MIANPPRSPPKKVTMKKINGPNHPNLMKQYNIKQFPTIILVIIAIKRPMHSKVN